MYFAVSVYKKHRFFLLLLVVMHISFENRAIFGPLHKLSPAVYPDCSSVQLYIHAFSGNGALAINFFPSCAA